jgi:ribulose-bisphosphate carboxylase large chain
VTSVRQAWAAVQAGTPLPVYAAQMPELRRALAFFGQRA